MIEDADEVIGQERVAGMIENGRRAYREILPGERVYLGIDLSRNSKFFARSTTLVRRAYPPLLASAALLALAELTLILGGRPGVAVALTGLGAVIPMAVALVLLGSLRRWHAAVVGAQAHLDRGPVIDGVVDD